MKDLIIIGASGFGREVAWLVERINSKKKTWNLLGYIDDSEEMQNKTINSYPVIGTIDDVYKFPDTFFVVAIGSASTRERVVDRISAQMPNIKFGILMEQELEIFHIVVSNGIVLLNL